MFDKVELKLATRKDLNFLYNLKKKTLKQYIDGLWGWDNNFQRKNLLKHFNSNRISIILFATKKIGCLILRKSKNWIIVELIALKPEFQCKGIGTFIMKNVISQSQKENKPIFLQILKVNKRAIEFYLKLGFLQTSESETGFNMQYKKN
ncbi:MAG TPA: GNAT family N-acetyltransferase [Candidatus Lokiarchaeia archaeon]